jgi:hypothetical protein
VKKGRGIRQICNKTKNLKISGLLFVINRTFFLKQKKHRSRVEIYLVSINLKKLLKLNVIRLIVQILEKLKKKFDETTV